MTVCYLDTDDEITDAVARLRTADDRRFIVVVPPGSRIATSRINFRLLAREAQERAVTIGMVSREAGVRSLAISAGMPAYGSVEEAEASLPGGTPGTQPVPTPSAPAPPSLTTGVALATPVEPMVAQARRMAGETPNVRVGQPVRSAGTPAPSVPYGQTPAAVDLEQTRVLPRSSAVGQAHHPPPVGTLPSAGWADDPRVAQGQRPSRPRGRSITRRLFGWGIRLAIIGSIVGGALYGAYLFLPNVTVSLTPVTEVAGPLTVEVTADPAVAVADPDAGVVPAEQVDIPLSATDEFAATGEDVTLTPATGSVRFTSENTLFEVPIPEGTRVFTSDDTQFVTTETVTVPKASFQSGPSNVNATIRAVRAGPAGNVNAGAIDNLPQAIAVQLVKVNNPDRTTGGSRAVTRTPTQADYDDAMAALENSIDDQLAAALDDPLTTPRGLVSYPGTVHRERVTVTPGESDVVGQPVETFTLTAESRGTFLAVNESLVMDVAVQRLEASISSDVRLFTDSVAATAGEGRIVDGRIVYQASATGEQYRALDQGALVDSIRGKSITDARAILAAFGGVDITPWPDFIGTVPDDPRRINLTILQPERSTP
ncbi:MAG: baseplate J/gp47 family protein [Candidatus Limnocylindrales bacterium]